MTFNIFIPVKPVPASRPRISKYGNYYPKNYTQFRKEVFQFLRQYKKKNTSVPKAEFKVHLEIICHKPKKPSNTYPRGDVDNYAKSYLDSITYTDFIWEDDIQVVDLRVTKRYTKDEEEHGAKLKVEQLTRL